MYIYSIYVYMYVYICMYTVQEEYNWSWNGQKKDTYILFDFFLTYKKICQLSDAQRESYQRITLNCKNIYSCVYIACVYVFTHIYTSVRQTRSEKKNLSCAKK